MCVVRPRGWSGTSVSGGGTQTLVRHRVSLLGKTHKLFVRLGKKVKQQAQKIKSFVATLPGYANLLSIKCISLLSAAVLLIHINARTDFKALGELTACFVFIPRVYQSNTTCQTVAQPYAAADAYVSASVPCALITKRSGPYLHTFYERIKAKRVTGKGTSATIRKLLNTIFYTSNVAGHLNTA